MKGNGPRSSDGGLGWAAVWVWRLGPGVKACVDWMPQPVQGPGRPGLFAKLVPFWGWRGGSGRSGRAPGRYLPARQACCLLQCW